MNIDIQQYRLTIGSHSLVLMTKYKISKRLSALKYNIKTQNLRFYIKILLVCFSLLCSQADIKNQYSNLSYRKSLMKLRINISRLRHLNCQSLNVWFGLKWSTNGLSNNKLQHIINGNRRSLGYKLALWNCERGLIGPDGVSPKLQDIKKYISINRPHLFGIIEADIFGPMSNHRRLHKFDTDTLKSLLSIPGYSIELPSTWDLYGQARIVVFVSNEVKCVRRKSPQIVQDLPSITFEIGFGRARKTIVNYYYREWTNGVNGNSSLDGQHERLERHIAEWKGLVSEGKDFVSLGDANLCALSWNHSNYRFKNLSNQVKSFCFESSCKQLVNDYTRIQSYGDSLQQSCIDHVTTNVPDKCSIPNISAGGSSDHMAVLVTKFSRDIKHQPKTVRKRKYKHFVPASFLEDILINLQHGVFQPILATFDPDLAATLFSKTFGEILNKHAPLKTYQVRNNYVPWVSEETQIKMKLRDKMKAEASKDNDLEKLTTYKRLRN